MPAACLCLHLPAVGEVRAEDHDHNSFIHLHLSLLSFSAMETAWHFALHPSFLLLLTLSCLCLILCLGRHAFLPCPTPAMPHSTSKFLDRGRRQTDSFACFLHIFAPFSLHPDWTGLDRDGLVGHLFLSPPRSFAFCCMLPFCTHLFPTSFLILSLSHVRSIPSVW